MEQGIDGFPVTSERKHELLTSNLQLLVMHLDDINKSGERVHLGPGQSWRRYL